MTITVAQSTSQRTDNASTVVKAFVSNVASGNRIVVTVILANGNATPPSASAVSKSAGTATVGTWLQNKVKTHFNPLGFYVHAMEFSAPVTGSGSCTIMVTGAAGDYWLMGLQELHSSIGDIVLEGTNMADGTTGAPDTGNVTSAGTAIFIAVLATAAISSTSHTEDAAFTLLVEEEDAANHASGSIIYRIVSTGTTDSGSWTAPTNQHWAAVLTVYKEQASSGVSVSPAAATVKGSRANPSVVLGSLLINPAARTAKGATIASTVRLGSLTVSVATALAKAVSVAPSVVLGSLSLSPAARAAKAATVNPSIVLGSLIVTPAARSVRSAGVDPVVQLGSIVLVPGAVNFKGLTIDPTILSGGNIIVVPAPAAMKGLGISPSLVLGSIMITPAPRSARAIGIDPTAQLGSITLIPNAIVFRGRTVNPTVLSAIIALGLVRLRNTVVEIASLSNTRFDQASVSNTAHEKVTTEDEPL